MKTILLTGARAPVTLDLARALKTQGHRVIAAESMSFPLSKRSNAFSEFYTVTAPNHPSKGFITDLVSIIEKENVDLLIPTCEEAFHVSIGRESLKNARNGKCQVLVDDSAKLRSLRSKYEFNQMASSFGFGVPKSFSVRSAAEAKAAIHELTPVSKAIVVMKPEFSRFASKTLLLKRDEALEIIPSLSLTAGVPWVIQEFISGQEYCTYALSIEGKLFTQVTYDHEFTAGRGAGICFKAIRHPLIESWVSSFVQKTNYTGQIAFDFIERNGTVFPLECNPRATSGLHLIAQNSAFIQALTELKPPSTPIFPAEGTLGQLRLAMLVYGLVSINSFPRLAEWLKTFFFAREVIFSRKDLLPFLDQFVTFFNLTVEAKRSGISPLEVSTRDIEWNG